MAECPNVAETLFANVRNVEVEGEIFVKYDAENLDVSDSATGVPATLILLRVAIVFERMEVPSSIASVLSGLSERPFQQNQICNSSRHLSSWAKAVSIEMGDDDIELCIVRILLLHEAMSSGNVSDGRYIERRRPGPGRNLVARPGYTWWWRTWQIGCVQIDFWGEVAVKPVEGRTGNTEADVVYWGCRGLGYQMHFKCI